MNTSSNQRGSTHLVLLMAVLVFAVVGIVGYRVLGSNTPASDTSSAATSSKAVPAKINSPADVQKASNALDATPIDGSVNPDSLNSDLNSLL